MFATLAFIYTRRLLALRALPGSDDMHGYQNALRKLRKDEPMTHDEVNLAARIIGIRRSPMALSVPAAFMTMGIFYVLGSLEYLHGHGASERTFLGVHPDVHRHQPHHSDAQDRTPAQAPAKGSRAIACMSRRAAPAFPAVDVILRLRISPGRGK